MFKNVTPEKAITFTHVCVFLSYCWPPAPTATNSQLLRFKILKVVGTINALCLFLAMVYALYVHRKDPTDISKTVSLCVACGQVVTQTIFCTFRYEQFQRLIYEMTFYVENAKSHERCVLQEYIDKYSRFCIVLPFWMYMSTVVFVVGTFFLPQPFPANTEYPFAVDYEPIRATIYLHHTIVGFQCSAHGCLNVMSAMLMLFTSARFEILMIELRNVTDIASLIKCVEKYYHLRRYALDVADAVRFIALISVVICGTSMIFCGINIIGRQPITIKVQFLVLGGTVLLEVFMAAWPADHLIDTSQHVVRGAYESTWYYKSLKMQKYILCTLIPQRAVTVSIRCVMPVLCLGYYCSYVAKMFSFFTALRIMIDEEEN